MHRLFFSFCLMLSLTTVARANEFAIVVSRHGYTIDETGAPAAVLPQYSIVRIAEPMAEKRGFVAILRPGLNRRHPAPRRIHASQLLSDSDISFLNESDIESVRHDLSLLSAADSELKDLQSAVEESPFFDSSPHHVWILCRIAKIHLDRGDEQEAQQAIARAERIAEEALPGNGPITLDTLRIKAHIRSRNGDTARAIELLNEALLIASADLSDTHQLRAELLMDLAHEHRSVNNLLQATRCLRVAVRIRRELPSHAIELPRTLVQLGTLQLMMNQPDKAIPVLLDARNYYYDSHPDCADELADCLFALASAFAGELDTSGAACQYRQILKLPVSPEIRKRALIELEETAILENRPREANPVAGELSVPASVLKEPGERSLSSEPEHSLLDID